MRTFRKVRHKVKLSNYTKEFKRNLSLAFPVMMGEIGHVVVGLADNIMVGHLGAAELAAVSLGNTLIFIALAVGIGFSFSITPLIAEADGAKDTTKGKRVFQHGLILCGGMGVVLFLLLIFAKPVLSYMDQPVEVVKLAIPYLEIVALSIIPLMLFQGFKQFADGLSQTRYAMYALIVGNILNIIFNYLLIYGIWIFPRLEVEGAALGTLISRFFMFGILFYIIKSKDKFKPYFGPLLKSLNKKIFRRIWYLGFPTALQMLFEVGIFTASVFLAGTLGTIPQAANQIALNLASITYMIAVGIGVTATIRVANQKGKRDFPELRRIALSNFLLVFLIEAGFALMFILFKDLLPMIYIDNEEVIVLAANLLIIAALFQLSDGFQATILGALRGLQDVRIPSLICFVAYWIVGFPLCYFLGKEEVWGSIGIWIGLLAGLTASAIMLYIRFDLLSKNLIERNKPAGIY